MIEHKLIFPQSQPIIEATIAFADRAHKGQKRKYTGEPYITHPISVAERVYKVFPDVFMVQAAILHDVVEDTDVTQKDIEETFDYFVSRLVLELTEFSLPTDGNRKLRKEIDRRYLARVSSRAKLIKLADLIDNAESIFTYGKGFAKVYADEMSSLVDDLSGGLPEAKVLEDEAREILGIFKYLEL